MAVIDLDRIRPVAPRRRRRRVPTGVLAVVLTLPAVAALAGAAPWPAPLIVPVATIPVAVPWSAEPTVLLDAGVALVGEQATGAGPATVSAYDAQGGRRLWRTAFAREPAELRVMGTSVVVSAYDRVAGTWYVASLDRASGAFRWGEVPGAVLDARPDGPGVLLDDAAAAGTAPGAAFPSGTGTTDRPRTLRLVDPASGRPLWTRGVPAGARVDLSADRVVVTGSDGTAAVLDEAGGSTLATGQLGALIGTLVLTPGPAGRDPVPIAERARITVLPGTVLIWRQRDAVTAALSAFTLPGLTVRWTVTGTLLGQPMPCGTVICLADGNGLRAIDPATGTTRWYRQGLPRAVPLGTGRLLTATSGQTIDVAVLDARTGALLREAGDGWTAAYETGASSALLGRPDGSTRAWLAMLDVDRLVVRPLGYVSGVDPTACQAAGRLLACWSIAGWIRVYRLPG